MSTPYSLGLRRFQLISMELAQGGHWLHLQVAGVVAHGILIQKEGWCII